MLGPALARLAPTLLTPGIQPYLGVDDMRQRSTQSRRLRAAGSKKKRKGRRRSRSGRYGGRQRIGRPPPENHPSYPCLLRCSAAETSSSVYLEPIYTCIYIYIYTCIWGRCWLAGDFVAGPARQFPGRAALRAATGVRTSR